MGKQLIQDVEVRNARVSQGVIVDLNPATEPAKAVVMRAQPGHSPGAAGALNSGLQPQGHQDLRIDRGPAGPAFHGSNALEQGCQVEPLDKLPDRAGRVFGATKSSKGMAGSRVCDRHSAGAVEAWGQQRRIASRPLEVGSSDRRSASEQVAGRDSGSYPQDTPKTHSADVQLDYFTSSDLALLQ